jgi:hypothetical protein
MKIEHIIRKEVLSEEMKNQTLHFQGEQYFYFDSGNTRHVFANKNKTKVVKILINKNGFFTDFNQEEYDIYQNADETTKTALAKTEIHTEGFNTVIVQEFCNPIDQDERSMTIPETLFAESCRNEVGWTADGRLVCYDLSEYKRY